MWCITARACLAGSYRTARKRCGLDRRTGLGRCSPRSNHPDGQQSDEQPRVTSRPTSAVRKRRLSAAASLVHMLLILSGSYERIPRRLRLHGRYAVQPQLDALRLEAQCMGAAADRDCSALRHKWAPPGPAARARRRVICRYPAKSQANTTRATYCNMLVVLSRMRVHAAPLPSASIAGRTVGRGGEQPGMLIGRRLVDIFERRNTCPRSIQLSGGYSPIKGDFGRLPLRAALVEHVAERMARCSEPTAPTVAGRYDLSRCGVRNCLAGQTHSRFQNKPGDCFICWCDWLKSRRASDDMLVETADGKHRMYSVSQ